MRQVKITRGSFEVKAGRGRRSVSSSDSFSPIHKRLQEESIYEHIATQETSNSLPRINDPAPDSSQVNARPAEAFDYKANGSCSSSHPADFTPVCSTEFVEFARRSEEFKERGAQLVGLSVDSVPAHIAWIRNIEGHFGVKIDFPVIADLDTRVAQSYGLIHPGASETATVRAVFIIDPQQKVRALIYYPMSLGRNIDEVLRALDGLQTADQNACATPGQLAEGRQGRCPPAADHRRRVETHGARVPVEERGHGLVPVQARAWQVSGRSCARP